MKKSLLFLLCLLMSSCNMSFAATVSLPKTYSTNDTVTASNLNGNNNAILGAVNSGLDNANADTGNGFRFYEIKGSLPAAGTQGRTIYLTTDDTLNFDNGSAYVKVVTQSGTPAQGDILFFGSSGWEQLSAGTTGFVLKTLAAGSDPIWSLTVPYLILSEQSSAPSTGANEGAFYTKVFGGQSEGFYREESDGDEVQITKAGAVLASKLVFNSSTVFSSAAAPTSFTDLDLSSVVGSNQAIVLLRVESNSATADYKFRENGMTDDIGLDSNTQLGGGSSAATVANGNSAYIVVATDSSGIVEWKAQGAHTTIVHMVAYITAT